MDGQDLHVKESVTACDACVCVSSIVKTALRAFKVKTVVVKSEGNHRKLRIPDKYLLGQAGIHMHIDCNIADKDQKIPVLEANP